MLEREKILNFVSLALVRAWRLILWTRTQGPVERGL